MKKLDFTLMLTLVALAAPVNVRAETMAECMGNTITRGSDAGKNKELSKRCDNTWENYDECKKAAELVAAAVAAHQRTLQETCAKQAKNTASKITGQDKETENAKAVADDAKTFTKASEAKLDATNRTATKGKDMSEKAINLILNDETKLKKEKRGVVEKIVKDFKGSTYDTVMTAAQYAAALAKIDEAWKLLQSNPDLGNDKYADAYEATATYLNAEEVRLGSTYQRNQMSTAASSLNAKSLLNGGNISKFGETASSGSGLMGNIGTVAQVAGAAGALSGLSGANSSANSGLSGVSGLTTEAAKPTEVGATSLGNTLQNAGSLGTTPLGAESKTEASRKAAGLGNTSITVAGAEGDNATAASKMDTSLRDSLRSKLEGDSALAGAEDSELSEDAKKAVAEAKANGMMVGPDGQLVPIAPGGGAEAQNFQVAHSEMDDAVKDLLANFNEADQNEFATPGENLAQAAADGRRIASLQDAAAGIEGKNSSNLFVRVRSTVTRCVKKGSVTGLHKKI